MNWKFLLLLVVLAGAAVYAVMQLNQQPNPTRAAPADALLYPDLQTKINAATDIKISQAGGDTVVDLTRTEQGWVASNKNDYPADINTIRETLQALVDAKIIEQKTSNPEFYSRLGVADLAQAQSDADAMGIEIDGLDSPVRLIVGKRGAGGGATSQTYVRPADQAQSYLVSGTLALAKETQNWLQQPILEIPADRIQRVVIKQADGETLTVSKQKRTQTNFEVFNLLAGRELSYENVADPIANTVANLRLEDVLPATELNPIEQEAANVEFYTFDGLKLSATVFSQDETHYIHLRANFDADQQQQFASTTEQKAEVDEAEKSEPTAVEEDTEQANATTIEAEAKALDERLAPWVFAISQFKFDNLTKRLEDMLKPEAEDTSAASPAQPETLVPLPGVTEPTPLPSN